MIIRIDPSTGVPIWQQIVGQVTKQIVSGSLPAGERLPTVRELASELRVNPNTVARAYQELERDGVVETRRGLGSYARAISERHSIDERRQIIADRIDTLLIEATQLHIAHEDLLEIVRTRIKSTHTETKSSNIATSDYLSENTSR